MRLSALDLGDSADTAQLWRRHAGVETPVPAYHSNWRSDCASYTWVLENPAIFAYSLAKDCRKWEIVAQLLYTGVWLSRPPASPSRGSSEVMHVVKLGTASSLAIVVAPPCLCDYPFSSLKILTAGERLERSIPCVHMGTFGL